MSTGERIFTTISCHSALKPGYKLSQEKMEALIKE
jgi:DNA mismatch repair ATPase MutL